MNFVLAAGGTGGHMIPAHALAAELKSRGHGVLLITDERGARFPGLFEDVPVHILPAGRLGGGPIGWLKAARSVSKGRARGQAALPRAHGPTRSSASAAIRRSRRCSPPARMRIPTVLHEQNAVMGRVNRLLAGEAEAIGTAYDQVDRLKPRYRGKAVLVGNPVREEIARLGELPFPPFDEDRAAEDPRHRRQPGRDRARRGRARGARPARAVAAPPPAGRAAMPPRRHRARPQPICRARHSRPS